MYTYLFYSMLLHFKNMTETMRILFTTTYKYLVASNPEETRVRIVKAFCRRLSLKSPLRDIQSTSSMGTYFKGYNR